MRAKLYAAVALLSALLLSGGATSGEPARPLVVAVRHLPEFFSPATAWTEAEKQAVPLLFEGLVTPAADLRYRPLLATALPDGDRLENHIELVGAAWSDGECVVAGDVRHTFALLAARAPAWKELFELPRLQSPASLVLTAKHGQFDPWLPLTTPILPQQVRGKPLTDLGDPAFAKAPVGSGPFQVAGKMRDGDREVVVLRRNPKHAERRKEKPRIAEVRFVAYRDAAKDLAPVKPHVALDLLPGETAAVRGLGLSEVRTLLPPRVHIVAINQRVPALANVALRRALALSVERQALLDEHYQRAKLPEGAPRPSAVNGPFPVECWANAAPPRVPASLDQPELARSLAKEGAKAGALALTFKFAAGDPRQAAAAAAMTRRWQGLFEEAGVQAAIKPLPLPPHDLRQAIERHDYELALCTLERAETILPLVFLFDPHADALKPGGSNFLGGNDPKLQSLLTAIQARRQFSARRDLVHDLHAHLVETMPFIPLWQTPMTVALHADVHAPELDPLRLFADLDAWRIP